MEVREAVLRALREQSMLAGAEKVICALSGGADSVCLADVLLSLQTDLGVSLEFAHFNHLLRGQESRRDEDFVRAWCRERGAALHLGSGDAAAWAREHRLSPEEGARELRYAFLESLCDEKTRIATAHQADDQAETLLLNLLRGTGLRGLGGIPPVRGRIIRPLLEVSRAEILAYLSERGLEYVEDSTNFLPDARRNQLRLSVLPLLRELNPSFSAACSRTVRLLRADEEVLSSLSQGIWEDNNGEAVFSASRLTDLPAPLASRALRQAAQGFGVRLEEKHTLALLALAGSDSPSARLSLPKGLLARRRYDQLCIGRDADLCPGFPETELPFNAWTQIPGQSWSIFWGDADREAKINGKFIPFFFKKERICGNMHVRPRKSGDRLRLAGRPEKSLKKWMIEEKIPAEERGGIPVISDDLGIVAVPGLGADERVSAEAKVADALLLFLERT